MEIMGVIVMGLKSLGSVGCSTLGIRVTLAQDRFLGSASVARMMLSKAATDGMCHCSISWALSRSGPVAELPIKRRASVISSLVNGATTLHFGVPLYRLTPLYAGTCCLIDLHPVPFHSVGVVICPLVYLPPTTL